LHRIVLVYYSRWTAYPFRSLSNIRI
jgi:hypothetical protein